MNSADLIKKIEAAVGFFIEQRVVIIILSTER